MSSNMPFDICVQIMERLPVKTLIRFRSVCKAWKSFIDCSEFIAAYSFRHSQSQHLMIKETVRIGKKKEVKYISCVDDDSFPQQKIALTVPFLVQLTTKVIGSSHGLWCVTGYFQEPPNSCPTSRTQMVVLWNPSIRKSIAVVVPNVVHHHLFDFVLGFGVCPHTKDPKLVKVTFITDRRKMESISCIPSQVMVFTLSSEKWTTSCSNQLPRKSIEFENGSTQFENGYQEVIGQFIYFLAYDRTYVNDRFCSLMMSFDLSTDEFREVCLPDVLRESFLSISRLRESLVLLDYCVETTNKYVCDVWMMERGDPNAFTKLFTINPPNAAVSKTLGFRKSGEPIIEIQYHDLLFVTPCALVVYEPCSEHIRDLGIRRKMFSFFGSFYTESLLLLNRDDGQIIRC